MTSNSEDEARHKAKMEKRKAAQDAEIAAKKTEKGLLIVHTGKGKGKSTAAGLLLRAVGRGFREAWCNSAKARGRLGSATLSRRLVTGRLAYARRRLYLGDARQGAGRRRGGAGLVQGRRVDGRRLDPSLDPRRTQYRASLRASRSWTVLDKLRSRRPGLHVVVTGRNAKPEMIDAADLVTEMTPVKHHFTAGVKAQAGIEY